MESDRQMLGRFVMHLAGTLALMVASVMAAIALVGNTVGDLPESNIGPTHHFGETFRKFNELQTHDDLDVLFLGSSHAQRAFDPRYLSNLGVSAFNLGTTAQRPLNTQYILEAFFDQTEPDLTVLDIYWVLLEGAGAESAIDLVENGPLVPAFIRMIWDVHNAHAATTAIRRLTLVGRHEDARLEQAQFRPGRFVGRGYSEVSLESTADTILPAQSISMSKPSRKALRSIAEYVHSRGSQLVFVTAPMPRYTLDSMENLGGIRAEFRAFAESIDVPYIDFTTASQLTGVENYYDFGHLNRRGTDLFMPVLIDSLRMIAPQIFEGR